MSMTVDRGDIVWECDGCHETLQTNTSNFDAARNFLTRNAWKSYKRGLDWRHSCPDCQDDALPAAARAR